jgi:YD repeat-containing protein
VTSPRNVTSVTDSNGNVTSYSFDDFAQMRTQVSPVTGTTAYAYDAAGHVLTTTDANATPPRTDGGLGRVLTAVSTRTGRATETVTWTYDATSPPFGIVGDDAPPARRVSSQTGVSNAVFSRRSEKSGFEDERFVARQERPGLARMTHIARKVS